MIRLKRVYEPPAPEDGFRILVERLWPRGLSKDRAGVHLWLKEVAPSPALRAWYAHDEAKWPEFQRRYRAELEGSDALERLRALLAEHPTVTFIFAARDPERNSAAVLHALLAGSGKRARARTHAR
jgi:uncharacterized protein YeaO (DUF488 family)